MRYNVGMYGGSFNPLHIGHIDCIIRAANQCRELYIVLSVGTRRNEIDPRIRYRWLYTVTKHIGSVKILMLEDEFESKADYTEEAARADSEKVKAAIGKPIDVVFCGGDYDENSFWNYCYPESELVIIPRGDISSTAIRSDPYGHWDQIPAVVRPYYTKKVLLIGGESTGKSTLTINLANRFNGAYIDEAGRDISMRSGTDRLMLQSDFTEILLRHKLNEAEALQSGSKVLFIDTDALITQFYLRFLDGADSTANIALSDAIDGINRFDLILFLEPDVEFVQDGDRSEVIHCDREKYSRQIKDIFDRRGREYVCISGSYQERYEKAISYITELFLPEKRQAALTK